MRVPVSRIPHLTCGLSPRRRRYPAPQTRAVGGIFAQAIIGSRRVAHQPIEKFDNRTVRTAFSVVRNSTCLFQEPAIAGAELKKC